MFCVCCESFMSQSLHCWSEHQSKEVSQYQCPSLSQIYGARRDGGQVLEFIRQTVIHPSEEHNHSEGLLQ